MWNHWFIYKYMFNTIMKTSRLFANKLNHFTLLKYKRVLVALPKLGMVSLFNFNHINVHVVISYCGFNLHIPDDQWCWTFFTCLFTMHMSSLIKCLFRSFVHFLIEHNCSVLTQLLNCKFFVYSRYNFFVRYAFVTIFSQWPTFSFL